MNNLNSVNLIGRVVADLGQNDFGYLPTGTAKLSFSIAVNESRQVNGQWQDEASFFKLVLFGKFAENLKDKVRKGLKLAINGRLKQNRWKAQDGSNRSEIYILVNSYEFLDKIQNGQNYQNNGQENGEWDNPTWQ